ncbi:MAG: dipeptidase [Sporichthyaceae bacterium]
MATPWVWDQHACLPLSVNASVEPLARLGAGGGAFVSVNVGYSPQSRAQSTALLSAFRAGVSADEGMELAVDAASVRQIAARAHLAVAFDLEDCGPLEGDLANVEYFVRHGVRTMLPSYNHANAAGCGCLDVTDTGLTAWGRELIREMNAAGMVPDGSHCSVRTGLDICEVSTKPVIYSHSCLQSVWMHPRNITDEQARACAATGGVIGITGVGIFLGPNTPTIEAMITHLEAAVELVGIEHVGVSTDCSFDAADFLAEIAANPHLFDESYTRWGPIQWMQPETFLTLGEALLARGWTADDIAAVLHGNFLRVATQSW